MSSQIDADNPFGVNKNVSVDLQLTAKGDSPVKATVKANSNTSTTSVHNTSGHSLYGDDIKLPRPDSPLQ